MVSDWLNNACGMLMVGGKGLRLRPLTITIPKTLLPFGSFAIGEIIVRRMAACGISRVHIALGYMGALVRSYFETVTALEAELIFHQEPEPLGTAGALGLLPNTAIKKDTHRTMLI